MIRALVVLSTAALCAALTSGIAGAQEQRPLPVAFVFSAADGIVFGSTTLTARGIGDGRYVAEALCHRDEPGNVAFAYVSSYPGITDSSSYFVQPLGRVIDTIIATGQLSPTYIFSATEPNMISPKPRPTSGLPGWSTAANTIGFCPVPIDQPLST
ncbi:hypothetical protein CH298_02455 [Rhodococcoides fascians]|uniref:hypothetical protein n=1 Tax=Rhodococcoides fascians TaxID=1828 RepID=UPI000B9BF432|nr:hypothetical protein [Rhodococcus fascians]OZE92419.1 hypothetical protein CH303_02455 [Rhodococcus fascians]OZF23052.1 hypothetical protein CH298_02455 [Rhodococcus fascians]OZF24766.1 hypothetical protein CH297_02455 [Rhodococcus fascians]OZF73015.1 hypothetical protein CH308_02460 [Rhodococcus fascians]OZF74180.1 hypothetical protein CH307_02455 [Rhodococcus fascians]